MKPRIFAMCLLAVGTTVHAQQALTERLAACNACHGERGEGRVANEYYPHLAGKPAGYLLAQLQAFRDGRRVYPQMNWLMRNMDDAYLAAIAAHFAAFEPRTQAVAAAVDARVSARAMQLVTQGDAARHLPSCAACHGENLAGLEPGVPALVGLPVDYVIAQLGAWRTGVRQARAPDCMAEIAKALAPDELRVLGTWLAAQGHDTPVRPAPARSFDLPRECGSTAVSGAAPEARSESMQAPAAPEPAAPVRGEAVESPEPSVHAEVRAQASVRHERIVVQANAPARDERVEARAEASVRGQPVRPHAGRSTPGAAR